MIYWTLREMPVKDVVQDLGNILWFLGKVLIKYNKNKFGLLIYVFRNNFSCEDQHQMSQAFIAYQTPGVISHPVGTEGPFLVWPSAEPICLYQEERSGRSWLSVRLLTEFHVVRLSCKRDICSVPPTM